MDQSAIDNWTRKPRPGERRRPGAQIIYSAIAIGSMLTLKAVFHLPLRATEGFVRSIIELEGLSERLRAPNYSTLSRRGRKLHVDLGVQHGSEESLHLVVDSTGSDSIVEGDAVSHLRYRSLP